MPTISGPQLISKFLIEEEDKGPYIVVVPLPIEILFGYLQMPVVWGKPLREPYDPAMQGQTDLKTPPTLAKKVKESSKYPPEQSLTLLVGEQ